MVLKLHSPKNRSCRLWLSRVARVCLGLPVLPLGGLVAKAGAPQRPRSLPVKKTPTSPFSSQDEALLDEIEQANFRYFWTQAHPETGMVLDRCDARNPITRELGSIAATGFGLTALCIGEKRGYMSRPAVQDRVLTTLRFLWKKLPNHRGFFYHFANVNTGERIWDSEVSSVDTAILLCGILACRQHFQNSEISQLASAIFNRVDWSWLSEDTSLLPHGWTPEMGFLPYRWDGWKRITFEYDGLRYIGSFAPLFVHQYSQAWFDFRKKRDQYTDYFQNSIVATEV